MSLPAPVRFRFQPKLRDTLRGYDRAQLLQDISAGLTVGVLALPLAMAFAIASGLSPSAGIWTAIIAGGLISALGGSRVQIGGPTGAFIPIVYGVVLVHGVDNLLIATLIAGMILFAMGATRLGNLIRFIPIAVVIGFTNGIAVVIFLSQVKDFFGLQISGAIPAEFFARIRLLFAHAHTAQLDTVLLALGTALVIVLWPRLTGPARWLARIPPQLAGLLVGSFAAVLTGMQVETIGDRFGGIPRELPSLAFPTFTLSTLGQLLVPALTIALLGAIESLLSARVADSAVDDRHDPNQELMAQGVANMVVPFFGGFAATGAIARTATNIRAGGRTPVAGLVHALTLLLIVLVAAPLAGDVPIAVLAAIVMVTAVRMGEWHEFARLKYFTWNYRLVLLSTFFMTVLFDLTIAVEIGMVLACLFFIYRMQALSTLERVPLGAAPPGAVVYCLHGSLFFGAIAKFDAQFDPASAPGRVVIFDLQEVVNIDTSGIDWLRAIRRALEKRGVHLLLCGLKPQPASLVARSGLAELLGERHIAQNVDDAIAYARELLHESAGE